MAIKKKYILITVICICIALLVIPIIYVIIMAGGDGPPVDDSNLIVTLPLAPSNNNNAVTYLNKAAKVLEPDNAVIFSMISSLKSSDHYHEQADWFFKKHASTFDLINRGLKCDNLYLKPSSHDPFRPDFHDRSQLDRSLDIITRSQEARAYYFFYRLKKPQIAIAIAMDHIWVSHMCDCYSRDPFIGLFQRINKEEGWDIFHSILLNSRFSLEDSRGIIRRLEAMKISPEILGHMVKLLYTSRRHEIDLYKKHFSIYPIHTRTIRKYQFKLNSTMRELYEIHSYAVDNAGKPYTEISAKITPKRSRRTFSRLLWKFHLVPNSYGKSLIMHSKYRLNDLFKEKLQHNVEVIAAQLIVAIRCFKLENGYLPMTLQQLVPRYLDEVPLDPFDGKPFRYLRDKKVLYSVGENLKDSGGPSNHEVKILHASIYNHNEIYRFSDYPAYLIE